MQMCKPFTIVTGGTAGIIAAGTAGITVGNAGIIAAGTAGTMATGITVALTTEPGMILIGTAGAGSIYSSDIMTSPGVKRRGFLLPLTNENVIETAACFSQCLI
jgi:hypothetical protein